MSESCVLYPLTTGLNGSSVDVFMLVDMVLVRQGVSAITGMGMELKFKILLHYFRGVK